MTPKPSAACMSGLVARSRGNRTVQTTGQTERAPRGQKRIFTMNLIHLKQQREELLNRADGILSAVERRSDKQLTQAESSAIDASMREVATIDAQVKVIEAKGTIRKLQGSHGAILMGNGPGPRGFEKPQPVVFSENYGQEFMEYVQSGGKKIGAALYEGSNAAGGYAVPIVVDDQIVPLAPQEMAVRRLATVIPTVSDIKLPIKSGFGTASAKAETSAFGESELTLTQTTLSAFMAGIQENVSWELTQDVPAFQATVVQDMLLAQQMYEENLYVNGNGSGQPQGLIGNVATPIVREPDSAGNTVSIAATLDLIGQLNAVYHPNASFAMSRATSIIIRKAQVGANLFQPVWTRDANGQDRLHGYPVEFSSYFPAAIRGNTPVLFGDFKRGLIIGDRGGSGINVKVLDQPLATSGIIILLCYRRTDSRVRRSEAIQALTIAAS